MLNKVSKFFKKTTRRQSLFLSFSVFLLSLFSLSSCVPSIEKLTAQEPVLRTKGGYDSYLALEYLTFSRKLLTVKDVKNSKYFAKKGLAVAAGKEVVPENPIKHRADKAQIEEMVLMQKRLEEILNTPYMKFHLPIQLAHLTYLYDCWITKESTAIFRADELAQCRVTFGKLIDEVENYIDNKSKDKNPKVEVREPELSRFEIMFDLNSFKLNDQASKNLIDVLKYLVALNGEYQILLVGNADRLGNELYNQNLALDRAKVVQNYLIKNGVSEDQIKLRSFGEDFPDIVTSDGAQNQLNRSVEIYVLQGEEKAFAPYPLPLLRNMIYREEVKRARVQRGLR